GVATVLFGIIKACAQNGHRLGAIAMLRAVVLHADDNAGRQVGDADRRFGLVDVLAAGALRAHGLDPEIGLLDVDVDILDLGQYRNRRRRRVNAPGALGVGNALYPMYAGLEFQSRERAAAFDRSNDLLEAASRAFA